MTSNRSTLIFFTRIQDVQQDTKRRGRTLRILNDTLYFRLNRQDPLYCYDMEDDRYVYISKNDWSKGYLPVTTRESCAVLNLGYVQFLKLRKALNIKPKYWYHYNGTDFNRDHIWKATYTIEDLAEMSRASTSKNVRGEDEVRRILSKDIYTTYVKTTSGEFIPTWDAQIY